MNDIIYATAPWLIIAYLAFIIEMKLIGRKKMLDYILLVPIVIMLVACFMALLEVWG